MPKAKRRFSFDKEKWIQKKNISRRKFVFLDTFAWSEIIAGDSQKFEDLEEVLIQSVKDKKIIVAINISLVTEAMGRDDTEQARSILGLFDILSDGVYLISSDALLSKELEEQIVSRVEGRPVRKLSSSVVFGPMAEMLGSFYIEQEADTSDDVDHRTVQTLFGAVAEMKLTDFPEIWMHRSAGFKKGMLDYLAERHKQTIPQMEYSNILKEEQFWLERHYIPLTTKVCNTILFRVIYEGLGSQELYRKIISQEIRQVFANCPTVSTVTEIQARLRLHKDMHQSLKFTDFYDVLHLSRAIPYCDYVLCDRGMAHMCRNELQLDTRYQTKIFNSNEINEFITKIRDYK